MATTPLGGFLNTGEGRTPLIHFTSDPNQPPYYQAPLWAVGVLGNDYFLHLADNPGNWLNLNALIMPDLGVNPVDTTQELPPDEPAGVVALGQGHLWLHVTSGRDRNWVHLNNLLPEESESSGGPCWFQYFTGDPLDTDNPTPTNYRPGTVLLAFTESGGQYFLKTSDDAVGWTNLASLARALAQVQVGARAVLVVTTNQPSNLVDHDWVRMPIGAGATVDIEYNCTGESFTPHEDRIVVDVSDLVDGPTAPQEVSHRFAAAWLAAGGTAGGYALVVENEDNPNSWRARFDGPHDNLDPPAVDNIASGLFTFEGPQYGAFPLVNLIPVIQELRNLALGAAVKVRTYDINFTRFLAFTGDTNHTIDFSANLPAGSLLVDAFAQTRTPYAAPGLTVASIKFGEAALPSDSLVLPVDAFAAGARTTGGTLPGDRAVSPIKIMLDITGATMEALTAGSVLLTILYRTTP